MLLAQVVMFTWIVSHGAALNPFSLMPIMLLYGVAQGTTVPRLMGTVLSNVAHDNAGAASGVLSTTQQFAFAIGVSVIEDCSFPCWARVLTPPIPPLTCMPSASFWRAISSCKS
jgi:hypothetical protein